VDVKSWQSSTDKYQTLLSKLLSNLSDILQRNHGTYINPNSNTREDKVLIPIQQLPLSAYKIPGDIKSIFFGINTSHLSEALPLHQVNGTKENDHQKLYPVSDDKTMEQNLKDLQKEIKQLEEEVFQVHNDIHNLEKNTQNERNRLASLTTVDELERIGSNLSRIQKTLSGYVEMIGVFTEENCKAEETRREMEIMWESRLTKFKKELIKSEQQLNTKRHESLYGKRDLRKKWMTIENLKGQARKGIILIFLFVVWPLIASSLWDLFKRSVLIRIIVVLVRYVLLFLQYLRNSPRRK